MIPRLVCDWKEDDVVVGTIEQRRQRWLEPAGQRRRSARAHADRAASWSRASSYVTCLLADLDALRKAVSDDARTPEERDEAARRLHAYWGVHQQCAIDRVSRPTARFAKAGWVRISEASKLSGLPARTLRRWCDEHRLPARKRGAFWDVNLKQLERWLAGWAEGDDVRTSEAESLSLRAWTHR